MSICKYRVMVKGEDGTLFCVANNTLEKDLESIVEKTEEAYPCAEIWAELEGMYK